MNIKANRSIFDEMESNAAFKEFIGNIISHYLNIANQDRMTYEIPEGVSDVIDPVVMIHCDNEGTIYLTENGHLDDY